MAATPPPPAFSFTITPSYVSQYLFRGQRLSGQSLQPSVELNYGKLGAGVWASFPVAGSLPGGSNPEVDPYAYYAFTLSDDVSLVPGITWYTYPRADPGNGFFRSTIEPNLALSWNFHGVKLTPKVYYDLTLEGPTTELSAAYALPLKELGTELDFNAQAGDYLWHDSANHATPAVKAWGRYWLLGVTVPFQLSSASRVSVGFAYTKGERAFTKAGGQPRQANPIAVGRGVLSLSYSCTF
jgi:hypothetical protein